MSGDVVPLRTGKRICRANSVRSSCYSAKAAALKGEDRQRRLLVMEAKLFGEFGRTAVRQEQVLPHPDELFSCAEGNIWYFFSETAQKFILTDFEFDAGGSGGLPLPPTSDSPLEVRSKSSAHISWMDRIAARALKTATVGRLAAGGRALAGRVADAVCGVALRQLSRLILSAQFALQRSREWGLLQRLATSETVATIGTIPRWSLLARYVRNPAQLDSYYARSILVGETLCRVGQDLSMKARTHSWIFAREDLGETIYPRMTDDQLLDESLFVIDSLFGNQIVCADNDEVRNATFKNTLQREFLGDDKSLSLLRSEIVLRLAESLARRTVELSSRIDRNPKHDGDLRSLLNKYALLNEFLIVSEHLFCLHGEPVSYSPGQLRTYRKDDCNATIWRLAAFDRSIRMALGPQGPTSRIASKEIEVLHDRLVGLTSEILAS